MVPFKSASRAREYYTQALVKEDYWSKAAAVAGLWFGKAAEMLGLPGEVKAKDFEALAINKHPMTGETITVRNRKGRVVGFDMNFGVPKSVSILYAFTGDQKIIDIILEANRKMMEAIERDVETQVRLGGKTGTRMVSNMAYATFLHHTGRPVGGIPDPQLHTHNFVMNLCYDGEESRFKAIHFRHLKKNAPYYEAIGRSYLAKGLEDYGYSVRKVNKAFEIEGFSRPLIQKYSRRSTQIDQLIAEMGIEDAKARDKMGAISRESKKSNITPQQTLAAWTARLDDDEKRIIQNIIRNRGHREVKTITALQAVDYAMAHCFEYKSVAKMRDVFREAVVYGYGALLPDEIEREIASRNLTTGMIRGVEHCTSHSVLNEERQIMQFVRRGKGRFMPFASYDYQVSRTYLSAEQVMAVRDMLVSRSQVIGLQGGAGVGKTTSMQEVVEAIELSGKKVFTYAPTNKARDTLKKDGFKDAATLESLLINPGLQKQVKGQVVLVDEAGMVGSEDMLELFRIAGNNTRILLTGDIYQHSSVDRGEPFRLLQQYKVLPCARISAIIRQKEGYYRDAAQALAHGDAESAFGYLDAMGAILEIEKSRDRYHALAKEYVACCDVGERPLLISPTHAEGRLVTKAIREYLKANGKLGENHRIIQLQDLQWSDAEKGRTELYREGYQVQFHQNAKGGIIRSSRFAVAGHDDDGRVLIADPKGTTRVLNVAEAAKFQVYRPREVSLANGDLIRMNRGDRFSDGRRYYRGQVYQISRIYPSGSIKLKNGGLLKAGYGHISHGYVSTSHAAQSKSHDAPVFLVQSAKSLGASSLNQFNVSVTRGKNDFYLYTDNAEQLKNAVQLYQNDLSATEFYNNQASKFVSNDENEKSEYFKDPETGKLTITDKEYASIFNDKGDFRHTTGFVKHDVGGSFVDYVNHRRSKFSDLSPQMTAVQHNQMQKNRGNVSAVPAKEALKHWKTHLKSPKQNLAASIKTKSGITVTAAPLGQRKNWRESLQNTKAKPLGEVMKERQQVKSATANKGKVGEKKSTAKSTAKASDKKISPSAEVKGKDKGKSKAATPPAPKPPPPKPPVIVKGK